MKNFILSFIFIISFAAHAEINSYTCVLENESDAPAALALKLPNYSHQTLVVNFFQCKISGENAHFDICGVAGNSLIIGTNPAHSVLLTPKGKSIEFSCEESVIDETDDHQDQPGENQEEQQEENDPGHGGSNVRRRGITSKT